ncbi:MAG: hypothetical protein KBT48_02210 [Firmicutes bacterium]|nr:hypothetical protein [Bacillota bacterium]
MRVELNKVSNRIDINQYTLKEYVEYLKSFDSKVFVVELEDRVIEIKFQSSQFPHLIGFQYAYDSRKNQKKYKGKLALDTMETFSLDSFRRNVNKNKVKVSNKTISWENDIQPRVEWLPFF